jgi:hypothetical protein
MSNERIDLNQFEAITKGKWEVIDTPAGGIDIGVRHSGGHSPVVTFTQGMGEQVRKIERDVADMNAIAAVPELIAELKDLRWKHMQVLKQRKDLRDEGLRMAKKLDSDGNLIESLIDALRIIRDDLDEGIAQGHLPIKSTDGIDATKIRNFANDATQ